MELKWEKTTFGELPYSVLFSPYTEQATGGSYLCLHIKRSDNQFAADTPVYRLVTPGREALQKIVWVVSDTDRAWSIRLKQIHAIATAALENGGEG